MATRFCGSLRLSIRYSDATETYSVRVHEGKTLLASLTGIGMAPVFADRLSVDCPEAFDRIAECAVSFAGHENEDIYAYADTTDNGMNLIRRKEHSTDLVPHQTEAITEEG